MNIELVMQFNDAYAEMGNIAAERARQYCDRHGYKLRVFRDMPIVGDPFWSKVKRLRLISLEPRAFDAYLFWMDADTLILDLDYPLTNLISSDGMDISQDSNGLCTGVFGVHTKTKSRTLLGIWLFLGQVRDETEFGQPGLHEQATLMLLEREFPAVRSMIHRIPESVVSCPTTGLADCAGAFIHHFWARTRNPAEVAAEMRARLKSTS